MNEQISQPKIPPQSVAPVIRPWYRSSATYILTFLFLTPIWAILLITDRLQKPLTRWIAGAVAIFYCFAIAVVFPLLGYIQSNRAAATVKIDDFGCILASESPYDGQLSGTVRNTGGSALRFVRLRGTVTDLAGQVIGTNSSYISSDILLPGAISEFSFYVQYPYGQGERCHISVESASYGP